MQLQAEMRHVNLHKCKTAQALKSLCVDMSLPSQNHLQDCSHIMTSSYKNWTSNETAVILLHRQIIREGRSGHIFAKWVT